MSSADTPKDIWAFYGLVDKIKTALSDNGEQDWAARLDRSLGGSTSGEILSDLGNDFDALSYSGVPRRLGLCPDVNLAGAFVHEALRSVGQRAPEPVWCE
jgi:hypothetical protein